MALQFLRSGQFQGSLSSLFSQFSLKTLVSLLPGLHRFIAVKVLGLICLQLLQINSCILKHKL